MLGTKHEVRGNFQLQVQAICVNEKVELEMYPFVLKLAN